MKRMFELFLVIFILFIIIYTFMYFFYFNSLCDSYSWINEKNYVISINKLAICKDSLVCKPNYIESDKMNHIKNWECNRIDFPIFTKEFYIDWFNNLNNRINK